MPLHSEWQLSGDECGGVSTVGKAAGEGRQLPSASRRPTALRIEPTRALTGIPDPEALSMRSPVSSIIIGSSMCAHRFDALALGAGRVGRPQGGYWHVGAGSRRHHPALALGPAVPGAPAEGHRDAVAGASARPLPHCGGTTSALASIGTGLRTGRQCGGRGFGRSLAFGGDRLGPEPMLYLPSDEWRARPTGCRVPVSPARETGIPGYALDSCPFGCASKVLQMGSLSAEPGSLRT